MSVSFFSEQSLHMYVHKYSQTFSQKCREAEGSIFTLEESISRNIYL